MDQCIANIADTYVYNGHGFYALL